MISVLVSSAVDREFEPRSGQTKDYKIGIRCFSANHAGFIKIEYPGKTRCRHAKDNNWFTRLSHVDLNTYNYLSRVVVVRPLWCFVV
jgi:hypothetical protein